jgi:integration host factor subunit beta
MTKADLVEKVVSRIEINKRQAEAVINAMIQSISDSLVGGDRVIVQGFGSFRVRARNGRNFRNPKSGEIVAVPAKKVPFFTAGKDLRAMVDVDVLTEGLRDCP